MFDGFQLDRVDVGEVTLRVRYGGQGQPVVLLHALLRDEAENFLRTAKHQRPLSGVLPNRCECGSAGWMD
jgi:hypothetical protein